MQNRGQQMINNRWIIHKDYKKDCKDKWYIEYEFSSSPIKLAVLRRVTNPTRLHEVLDHLAETVYEKTK